MVTRFAAITLVACLLGTGTSLADEYQISGTYSGVGGAQGFQPFNNAGDGDAFKIDLFTSDQSLRGSLSAGTLSLSEAITSAQLFDGSGNQIGSFNETGTLTATIDVHGVPAITQITAADTASPNGVPGTYLSFSFLQTAVSSTFQMVESYFYDVCCLSQPIALETGGIGNSTDATISAVPAPEIDPKSAFNGIVLFLGTLVMITESRRRISIHRK
jgi:hypothetical protein